MGIRGKFGSAEDEQMNENHPGPQISLLNKS